MAQSLNRFNCKIFLADKVSSLCGYPGAPAHSSVEFSNRGGGTGPGGGAQGDLGAGTIAEYNCDRGFELLGPARRVCGENGTWSPQGIPFCGKHCILFQKIIVKLELVSNQRMYIVRRNRLNSN